MSGHDWNYTKEIDAVSEYLWNALEQPIAIYLRGTSAKSTKYRPWDIDLYLICHDSDQSNLKEVVSFLDKEYEALPELDVTVFSQNDFIEGKIDSLRTLLLLHDGNLIKGSCMKNKVQPLPLNKKTADKVKKRMYGYLEDRLNTIYAIIETSGSEGELDYSFKKAAKMIVRAGCFVGIENNGVFTRYLPTCLENLIHEYPEISPELKYLYSSLGEKSVDSQEFVNALDRAQKTIYSE